MRFLFLLVLALNIALFAFGQGLFGTPPDERGRDAMTLPERNPQAVAIEPARADTPAGAAAQS